MRYYDTKTDTTYQLTSKTSAARGTLNILYFVKVGSKGSGAFNVQLTDTYFELLLINKQIICE